MKRGFVRPARGIRTCIKIFEDSQANFERRDQITFSMIRKYIEDHQLNIRYYHDYGWDPVDLFPEKQDTQP